MISKLTTFNRRFASKVTRALPTRDMSLKEHDPEIYNLIEKEKAR